MRCHGVVRLLQDEDGSPAAAASGTGTPPASREARHLENAFFLRESKVPRGAWGPAFAAGAELRRGTASALPAAVISHGVPQIRAAAGGCPSRS